MKKESCSKYLMGSSSIKLFSKITRLVLDLLRLTSLIFPLTTISSISSEKRLKDKKKKQEVNKRNETLNIIFIKLSLRHYYMDQVQRVPYGLRLKPPPTTRYYINTCHLVLRNPWKKSVFWILIRSVCNKICSELINTKIKEKVWQEK